MKKQLYFILIILCIANLNAQHYKLDDTYKNSIYSGIIFHGLSINTSDYCYSGTLQFDKKIINVGSRNSQPYITRQNVNGSSDSTFADNGSFILNKNGRFTKAVIQSNGKIVVCGNILNSSNNYNSIILRLTVNGTIDSSFGNNGMKILNFNIDSLSYARHITINPDDNFYVSGFYATDSFTFNYIYKLLPDGLIDSSFNNIGYVSFDTSNVTSNPIIMDMDIQSDGKIVCVYLNERIFPYTNSNLIRFNTNGSLDSTFGSFGESSVLIDTFTLFANSMEISHDDNIYLIGSIYANYPYGAFVAKYTKDGILNTTFNSTGYDIQENISTRINYYDIKEDYDNSLLIAGTYYELEKSFMFKKYNTSGNLINTFADNGTFYNSDYPFYDKNLNTLLIQDTNKYIYTAGTIYPFSYFSSLRIVVDKTYSIPSEQQSLESSFIYPNPFTNQLNLEFELNANSAINIQIFDLYGKCLKSFNYNSVGIGKHIEILNLSNELESGIYFVDLQVNSQQHKTYKLVKN